jgi:hypothetical protein
MLSCVAYRIPAGSLLTVKLGIRTLTVQVANESPIFAADVISTEPHADGTVDVVYKGSVEGRAAKFTAVLPS